MFYHETQVPTITLRGALVGLLQFLRKIGKPVALIAHNGFQLDAPLIIKNMQVSGLWEEFYSIVYGFIDTLPLLRSKLIDRKTAKLKFNQDSLVHDILGNDYMKGAHNALTDVNNLEQILQKTKVNDENLKKWTKSISAIVENMERLAERNKNKEMLNCLKGFVSNNMINKIAEIGITLHHLQLAYTTNKEKGVINLFTEDVGGHPRISKSKKVIQEAILGIKKSLCNNNTN